jgi:hypothetical protein
MHGKQRQLVSVPIVENLSSNQTFSALPVAAGWDKSETDQEIAHFFIMTRTRKSFPVGTIQFASFLLFTSLLTACSLSPDITPPPGYAIPYRTTASRQVSSPSATTRLLQTEAPLSGQEQVSREMATQNENSRVTPDASTTLAASITGSVLNGTSSKAASGEVVSLHTYSMTADKELDLVSGTTDMNGRFSFSRGEVSPSDKLAFWITADHQGVTYTSEVVSPGENQSAFDLKLTIFDATENWNSLLIPQVHLKMEFPNTSQVDIRALYILSNPLTKSILISTDGESLPFIKVPSGARDVQFQEAENSSPLMRAEGGFAFTPGQDKQYGIIVSFSLPYKGSLVLSNPFTLPVNSATVIVPQGIRVTSEQLADTGNQDVSGVTYHFYQGGNLAGGTSMTMNLSGMPGDENASTLSQRGAWVVIIACLGLLLIVLGITLYARERKTKRLQEQSYENSENGNNQEGKDRESLMDGILALDDQYRAGQISKIAYTKRREALKASLKKLLDEQGTLHEPPPSA